MDIENIRLIFKDGGIIDEVGTMMVGANHLGESLHGNSTLCGISTAGADNYCWSYYDPDPTDYDNYQELLLENVECDECEAALLKIIEKSYGNGSTDPDLGTCCVCDATIGVRNIVMLDQKSPVPGHGWGCFQCGLPCDGASAVVCDGCLEKPLKFACRGYPGIDGRIPIEELSGDIQHDYVKHPEAWWFEDSPDAGDPDCICSICRQEIPHAENVLRMYQGEGKEMVEARFHEHCFEEVRHLFAWN